jgi:predicted metal-dependent peptidase
MTAAVRSDPAAPEVDARGFLYAIQRRKHATGVAVASGEAEDRKNVLDLNILIGVDVSGSISATQFKQFMRQIDAIRGLSRVRIVEIDSEIVAFYDYFRLNGARVVRLGGGGGTAFEKAFAMARRLRPDAILFMTDGMVADTVQSPGIPTGWVLTNDGVQPYGFGTVVVRLP